MKLLGKLSIGLFGLGALLYLGAMQTRAQTLSVDVGPDRLNIISKPKPAYAEIARKKNLHGSVRLRVEFLSSGKIGQVVDVTKKKRDKLAKYGLTEAAIDAAKRIIFEPAKKGGIPVTEVHVIEYSFLIY